MSYILTLDQNNGTFLSVNRRTYSGTFTQSNLSNLERGDLMHAAQNSVDAHYLLESKIAEKCIASLVGDNGLQVIITDKLESKN